MSSIGRVRVNRAGDPHRLVAGNAEDLDLVGLAERSVWNKSVYREVAHSEALFT